MTNSSVAALRIVVPDDAPAAVAGSAQEAKLQALGGLQTYDSLASTPDLLLERIRALLRRHQVINTESVDAEPPLMQDSMLFAGVTTC